MKVYAALLPLPDGSVYSIRYLLEPEELIGLQEAGLVPLDAAEVIGMQDAADRLMAGLQKQFYTDSGGVMQ